MITKQVKYRSNTYGNTRATNILLKILTEIEAYSLVEVDVCDRIAKKMKGFNTITSLIDTGLITLTIITRYVSIVTFASSAYLPVGITLSGTCLLFLLQHHLHKNPLKY